MMMRVALCVCLVATGALAVGTSTWNHTSEADFKAGSFEQVVATNQGDLKLSRAVKTLLEQDPDVSAVYTLAEGKDGAVYAGTGPNGLLLRIADGKTTRVATIDKATNIQSLLALPDGGLLVGTVGEHGRVMQIDKPQDEKPAVREIFSAEGVQYIWAMCRSSDGNLYVATGPNGQLFEVNAEGKQRVLFDSEENNLTAMVWDGRDKLYVGTDPNGLVYRVDRKTGESFVLYDANESEVSSLLIDRTGNIYVATSAAVENAAAAPNAPEKEGSGRPEGGPAGGAINKEAPKEPAPPALPEPTPGQPKPIPKNAEPSNPEQSLLMRRGKRTRLAGGAKPQATSRADWVEVKFIDGPNLAAPKPPAPPGPNPPPGQPKPPAPPGPKPGPASQPSVAPPSAPQVVPPQPEPGNETPPNGNAIYRIDRDGFVTEVFRQNVTIFSVVEHQGSLLVATGADGRIFELRPEAEETVVVAKVEPREVMCLLPAKDGNVYLGMANAGGIGSMSSGFASHGTFTSAVLDAGQISRFGKIHLNGTLPEGTTLTVATRSGNVKDATERGWSPWSKEMPAAQFLQTPSPSARFLQYRLTFESRSGSATAIVEDVSLAYQVPNLAPVVNSVKVTSPEAALVAAAAATAGGEAAPPVKLPPSHRLVIAWESSDANSDPLTYTVSFRAGSEGPWIALKEKATENSYEWDTRGVADGRYQVRVTASDALANVPGTGKSTSRVSEPVTIDNTPPAIGDLHAEVSGRDAKVSLRIVDRTGTVSSAEYAVDSSRDWQAFLPSDTIWDSPEETASFTAANLAPGPHQIGVRATDSAGNVAYETVYVTVKDAPAAAKR